MFPGGGSNRIGAAVALAAVLAMVLAAPAGATGWGEERIWGGGLFQQVLTWLRLTPSPAVPAKDAGSSIDPNGSPKKISKQGSSIDPNGGSTTSAGTIDQGSQIDPNGRY